MQALKLGKAIISEDDFLELIRSRPGTGEPSKSSSKKPPKTEVSEDVKQDAKARKGLLFHTKEEKPKNEDKIKIEAKLSPEGRPVPARLSSKIAPSAFQGSAPPSPLQTFSQSSVQSSPGSSQATLPLSSQGVELLGEDLLTDKCK